MKNLAAVVVTAKTPLEVQEVEMYEPGPKELLVKNELIALNPVEAKVAKIDMFKSQYPLIIGGSFGGTVVAVGADVLDYKVGDKVATFSDPFTNNKYSAYQRYALIPTEVATKILDEKDFATIISLVGNLPTVVGLLGAYLGLKRPYLQNTASLPTAKKILIYGGTSSIGSLSVQYLSQAGYQVVTTTDTDHQDFVSKLGAQKIVNHTQDPDTVIKQLVEQGPYDIIVDIISVDETIYITSGVVKAQGGGIFYATLPPFGPEKYLADGVERKFESYPLFLDEERNSELKRWAFHTYLPQDVANGKILPLKLKKLPGGLRAMNETLDILNKGVPCTKLLVDPWEE